MDFVFHLRKIVVLLTVVTLVRASENIGFLFTAPRTFLSGYDENVCITFRNQTEIIHVRVVILEKKEDIEITSASEEITPKDYGGKCFKISIPRTKIKSGRLQLTIHSKTEEDFKINYVEQISVQTNPDITFIQTDKPIYNSGHIVRLRIFTLRSDLTPVLEPVDKIWIENPNGVHLAQWLNESPRQGFITKTFRLSKEPLPGKWFVKVQRKNEDAVAQSFLVENYILPKFSVVIKAPDYIENSSGNVTICAKYLFGQPVHGEVTLQYFVKCSFSYYCQESGSPVTKNLRLNADGCVVHEISLTNLSSFAQSLVINATVNEDGSLTKGKAFSKIEIKNSRKRSQPEFTTSTKRRKFKPGLPFRGQVITKGQPGANQWISVCLNVNEEKTCKELIMRENLADFLVMPLPIRNEKTFKAFLEIKKHEVSSESNHISKLSLVPWYSPSGSYLQLEDLSEAPLRCGLKAKLGVLYSSVDPPSPLQFHYMVKARGDIIDKGILNHFSVTSRPFDALRTSNVINRGDLRNVKHFQFFIDINPFMAPSTYLIVYFIRGDGEVVADTLNLKVEKCLDNKVVTKWEKNLSLPGSENNFFVETSPNSLCALTVTDKSTKLVVNSDEFNEEKVFKKIEQFEVKPPSAENTSNRCRENSELQEKAAQNEMESLSYPQESDSRFVDSLQAFNDFGALVITDLDLETRPCREKGNEERTNATTRSSKFNVFGNEIENISVFKAEESLNSNQPTFREPSYELRNFFPETWIWDLIPVNNSGTANLNVTVPHTITEWTAETVCLSSAKGLGISKSSQLVTYQPFFLDFTVPHSLKRKEIFHLHVSVFNYEATDLPVKITLSPLRSFISRSEESRSYCIRTKSKIVHRFVLESVKLGEAQIKIKAEIDSSFVGSCGNKMAGKSDTVVKKTIVKHEGFPMEEVKSGFICSSSSNFDQRVSWNMKVPADVVESSIEVKALVSGDILGPSLKNIDHLITLPTGCGEQNMMLLVPNVLLLDYLLLTKSEELEPIEKALKNLDLGYQRQLNYKHQDGSYSAFGKQDEKGSIWLTAFVVRYLSQARKYIYVDENDLNTSVSWIMKHQLENGCFPMIGKIYHRKLQEKLMEADSSKTLTAYILISLLEAGISLDNPIVRNAIYCLKPTEESLGTYGDLLSSYALILAGEFRDSQALMMELLKEARRSYGMLWWENDESIESSIEMTGYGILSLVKLGGPLFLAAASDAVRWLIQYQNQNGGFISSQDTVLALEAISKFSSTLPKTSEQDQLSVKVGTLEENFVFNISNSNRLLRQEVTLPSYLTRVQFESSGRGCALVQTSVRYNVRRGKTNENFKIQLRIHSLSNVDLYSAARFQVCVRYKSPKEKINMAVLEVPMVSGYYPDRTSLYEIRTSQKGVRRWEEYEDKVNFYFEDLRNKKVCVNFLVVQEVCIENAAPALIKLYDYYNTNHRTTMKYSLMRECQNGSWLENPYEIKQESKRDLKFKSEYQVDSYNGDNFQGFVDLDHDLETPKGGGEVYPVFALPPKSEYEGRHCPHCMNKIPTIFSKLYCSSDIAVKVLILSTETLELRMDVSPRKNFTSMKRTASFTMKGQCDCPILNSVNSYALLLVTPPRSFRVHYLQELHMDDSVQLYPWGNPNEMPGYLKDAVKYCQTWSPGDESWFS